ncbi:MAG: prepilin-type N-terminal cleavage/methylation domain-containing protein [Bifidobacteriaceae bacterium]|nr:prepilin-type N-terminal cleavage/methylation domain-containing protein [Bifidobacteriaceae bacterium]
MNSVYSTLRRRGREQAGFTFVELMVVVLVIGILAGVAIPIYNYQHKKTYINDIKATALSTRIAISDAIEQNDSSTMGLTMPGRENCRWDRGTAAPTSCTVGGNKIEVREGINVEIQPTNQTGTNIEWNNQIHFIVESTDLGLRCDYPYDNTYVGLSGIHNPSECPTLS